VRQDQWPGGSIGPDSDKGVDQEAHEDDCRDESLKNHGVG